MAKWNNYDEKACDKNQKTCKEDITKDEEARKQGGGFRATRSVRRDNDIEETMSAEVGTRGANAQVQVCPGKQWKVLRSAIP